MTGSACPAMQSCVAMRVYESINNSAGYISSLCKAARSMHHDGLPAALHDPLQGCSCCVSLMCLLDTGTIQCLLHEANIPSVAHGFAAVPPSSSPLLRSQKKGPTQCHMCFLRDGVATTRFLFTIILHRQIRKKEPQNVVDSQLESKPSDKPLMGPRATHAAS